MCHRVATRPFSVTNAEGTTLATVEDNFDLRSLSGLSLSDRLYLAEMRDVDASSVRM